MCLNFLNSNWKDIQVSQQENRVFLAILIISGYFFFNARCKIQQKAYDRVPREELWECLRLAETSECYIRIIQDMYDGATTTVRSAAGLTEEFKVGVGLHQGSALSPFLFVVIMDRLTENIRKDAPWDMLFADDIVLCRQNHGN